MAANCRLNCLKQVAPRNEFEAEARSEKQTLQGIQWLRTDFSGGTLIAVNPKSTPPKSSICDPFGIAHFRRLDVPVNQTGGWCPDQSPVVGRIKSSHRGYNFKTYTKRDSLRTAIIFWIITARSTANKYSITIAVWPLIAVISKMVTIPRCRRKH